MKAKSTKIDFLDLGLAVFAVLVISVAFTSVLNARNLEKGKREVIDIDQSNYLNNEMLADRLEFFCDELKSKGIEINQAGILYELFSVERRNLVSAVTRIPVERILLHTEIADLMRVGISEEHAQILLFSHVHQIDDYTKENLSVGLISQLDIYKMKMEVDEYASTHGVQTITLSELETYKGYCQKSLAVMEYGSLNANFIRK